jgi:hypothetical protein
MSEDSDRKEQERRLDQARRVADLALDPLKGWCRSWRDEYSAKWQIIAC